MTLDQPYRCKNGPLDSIEELLLVKGVTMGLLFGNDRNRNGVLDPDEDDGSGVLDRGWAAYLTIHSREQNVAIITDCLGELLLRLLALWQSHLVSPTLVTLDPIRSRVG